MVVLDDYYFQGSQPMDIGKIHGTNQLTDSTVSQLSTINKSNSERDSAKVSVRSYSLVEPCNVWCESQRTVTVIPDVGVYW